jgi:chromosome segregation ATPase
MSAPEEEILVHELREHEPTRPHSFDLTLELERQLEAESLPTSPARPEGRPQSLDTHVVASLVTSLRINVAELTKERDGLSAALDVARGREAELASELRQLKEAQVEKDAELVALHQKTRDDEESIVLLRSKVEESRSVLFACFVLCTMFSSSYHALKVAVSCGFKLKGRLKVGALVEVRT